MPLRASEFHPESWWRNPHLQTIWPQLTRSSRRPDARWERLELADGDFVDLVWGPVQPGPWVLLLHGLEGSDRSPYLRDLMGRLAACGMQPVLFLMRNCGREPNRLARSYHAGATEDLRAVAQALAARAPGGRLRAVGYSLGANLLLKGLGESPPLPIEAAVAVSPPFQLDRAAAHLHRGFARLYEGHLLRQLKRSLRRKRAELSAAGIPWSRVLEADSFYRFDDWITAPLHGFRDADDYYRRCSCRGFLPAIETATLILHARDDPFLPPDALPEASELGPGVTLELSEYGGHVGFVKGSPHRPHYWLPGRILGYLRGR